MFWANCLPWPEFPKFGRAFPLGAGWPNLCHPARALAPVFPRALTGPLVLIEFRLESLKFELGD